MLSLQSQISLYTRAQWALHAAMVLMVGGFYFFGYRPQTQHMADLRMQISTSQGDLGSGQSQTRQLPSVAAEVEQLKASLRKFKTVPKQQELAQFIRDISQLAQQSSLKKIDIREDPMIRGEKLNQKAINISFEGDFVSVFSFLRHTEDMQRLTRVPTLTIKGLGREGQVKVTMTINIYFQAE